jgi:hypothetical protein
LAHQLVSRIGASPLWRAGLASIFILGLAGFAAGVIPQACRSGVFSCAGESAPLAALDGAEVAALGASEAAIEAGGEAPSSGPPPSPSQVEWEPEAEAVAPVLGREPASISGNDLVAATFAALDAGLVTAPAELTSRSVRTVSIGADGQPETAVADVAPLEPEGGDTTASASAEPAPVVEASAEPETPPSEPEVEPQSSEVRVAEASEAISSEEVSTAAYAPMREGNAIVTGKGANVRSLPQKGGSEVLFALAGGAEVTVVQMSKGWAKIVDAQGRNGWIYGDYLRR